VRYFYVVTHPEASHHTEELVGGWYDSVLTARGHAHARQLAEELNRRMDVASHRRRRLVSSDLQRTQQTAEPIAIMLDLRVEFEPRLREQCNGEAEGHPVGTHPYYPVPKTADRMDFISGPGMESRAKWAARIYAAMDSLDDAASDATVIVTHGGSATYVIAWWIDMPLEAADRVKFRVSPGSITVLHDNDVHSDHLVAELNVTDHLTL